MLLVAAQGGHAEVVRLLLAHQDVEVNQTNEGGVSALLFASGNGHVEVVKLLLSHQNVELNKAVF